MHLRGRRHCEAVAQRYLRGAEPALVPTEGAAAAVLHEHSTVPLASAEVEPPDFALALLSEALSRTRTSPTRREMSELGPFGPVTVT